MHEPYEDPSVPPVNPDGSWFCPSCCSLNLAQSSRCYSCRTASPLMAPGMSGHRGRKLLAAALVASLVVLGIGGSMVLGRAASPTASASAPASLAADVPADTASPAPDLTATPVPSDSPTITPDITPPPTATPSVITAQPTPTVTLAPIDNTVPLPQFPVSVSGATLVWFKVSGASPGALLASDEAASKVACDMDSLACFHDTYKWTYRGSVDPKSGVCKITSVNLTATYTITLPRWSAPARVPAPLVSWWKQVLAHFVWHESQHMVIARSYAPAIKAAIASGPCTNSGSAAAVKAAMARLAKAQAAFDAVQTAANWQWPPYTGPWN